MTTPAEILQATAGDLTAIRALLAAAGLPFEDLEAAHLQNFIVMRDAAGKLAAAGGFEQYGRDGLLRSVVIDDAARGRGLGRKITLAIEARAKNAGVETFYLLTTTAGDFFPRLGYQIFDRASVPAAVAASTEFASLCPASAVCLKKAL